MTASSRRTAPSSAALLGRLRALADPVNVAGMARYGISSAGTLGVEMVALRGMASEVRRSAPSERHALAGELWRSGVHEARILAALVDEPELVGDAQAERWARDLDSWDVCDQLCLNLLRRTGFAWEKAAAWARREEPFVKRAGCVLMATLAVHAKEEGDERFLPFLALAEGQACDGRNFVRKAVSWAVRQIGKRSPALRRAAVATARRMGRGESKAARWVSRDALRDLDPVSAGAGRPGHRPAPRRPAAPGTRRTSGRGRGAG